MKKLIFFAFILFILLSCLEENSSDKVFDVGGEIGLSGCGSINECSDKETKDLVCVKKSCISIGNAEKPLHIVFYPRYISSVVNKISYFRYYYLYPLSVVGESITCEGLLLDYDFENKPELNIIQSYEKQATISSTGAEMYTLPLPSIKDSLIFFIFYQDSGGVVAIGCAEKIDTTSNNSVGIFPCKPEQTNACLGQF